MHAVYPSRWFEQEFTISDDGRIFISDKVSLSAVQAYRLLHFLEHRKPLLVSMVSFELWVSEEAVQVALEYAEKRFRYRVGPKAVFDAVLVQAFDNYVYDVEVMCDCIHDPMSYTVVFEDETFKVYKRNNLTQEEKEEVLYLERC